MPLKSIAFFFISFLWSSLSLLRRLYPRKKIPCFVCSIGNLQAGGAGKTPLIMEIAKQLLEKGYHPAILTRGYRGTKEHDITLLSPGKSFLAQEVGDEAALMHALLPKVLIGVGKNRFEVYQKMLQSPIPFNVILLDDGFGVTLKKDFDVLLLTPAKRFERFFKHFFWEKRFADTLILTKSSDSKQNTLHFDLFFEKTPCLPVWVICGIATPEVLLSQLQEKGILIGKTTFLKDHAEYSFAFLKDCFAKATHANLLILTTEKDAIKWPLSLLAKEDTDKLIIVKQKLSFGPTKKPLIESEFFQALLLRIQNYGQ